LNKAHFLLILPTLIFLRVGNLYCQQDSSAVSQQTMTLIREAPSSEGEKTGAVILLKDTRLKVDKRGFKTEVVRILGKIYSEQARSDYSQIVVSFDSYYEDIKLDYAHTITDSGVVRDVAKDAVQIKTSPDEAGDVEYSDTRFLTFALPGLDVGVAFEYQVTITGKRQPIPGQWFDYHQFPYIDWQLTSPPVFRADPVLESTFVLSVPSGSTFDYHFYVDSVKATKSRTADQDVYTWNLYHLPSLTIERSMPRWNETEPAVLFSSLDSWPQIDSWVTQTMASKISIGPQVALEANRITNGAETDSAKIKSIFRFIQNHIQYVAANLDRGGYTPHSPEEVLNSRFGDCKDQAILFISLLKAVGIKAYPALISPASYDQYTELPCPYFSHVIVFIPMKSGDLWLDTTPAVTKFPRLAYPDQNRRAFIVDGKGGRLVNTPASSAASNVLTLTFSDYFKDGAALLTMRFDGKGALSDAYKLVFKDMTREQIREYFRAIVLDRYPAAQIDTAFTSDLDNADSNFSATVSFRIDSAWDGTPKSLSFASNAPTPMWAFAGIDPANTPAVRHSDLITYFPFTIEGTERYSSPSRTLLTFNEPSADSLNDLFYGFSRRFDVTDTTVAARWVLTSKWVKVPKNKYGQYLADLKKLNDLATWTIYYHHPSAFWNKLLGRSLGSIVNDCSGLLAKDSTNALLLITRGEAYNQMGDYKASLVDIKKAIALTHGNPFAYLWGGQALAGMGKFDEAIRYQTYAIREDSTMAISFYDRGIDFSAESKYDSALDDFRSALKFDSTAPNVWEQIGYVRMRQNEHEKSIDAYRRSLVLDSANALTYANMAFNCLGLGSYPEAAAYYLKSISLDSTMSASYGNLGWVYYKLGNFDSCLYYSAKAVAMDSTSYYARLNIALAELRWGHIDESRKLYDQLISLGAKVDSSDIKAGIDDIDRLITQGIRVKEGTAILHDFFHVQPMKK
jgi:tetratricopeptide (TPR) repeat protein